MARVGSEDRRGRREAKIVEVLENANTRVVGRLYEEHGIQFVVAENRRISQDFLVAPGASGGAKAGQVVMLEIMQQPTKHAQPGFAASNAVTAALMASGGLPGVRQPLTGEDGFSRVYLHGRLDEERAVRDLGRVYEIERLSFKPYPTCRFTHPAISAALELRSQIGKDAGRIHLLILY